MRQLRRRPALTVGAILATLAAASLVVGGSTQVASASGGSSPDPNGVNASADAYVSGASPGTNYGTSNTLIANATGPVHTHLKFTVTGSQGATFATLQVYSTSSGTTKTQVFAEPSGWTETGITYANEPAKGAPLGGLSTLTAGNYSTLDVPISGDGTYSFLLTTTATANRNMTSRETATPPQLIIPPPSNDPVVVAAGDIACSPSDASFNNLDGTATACRSKYTEAIIQRLNPVYLLPLGDQQYDSGSPSDFSASYDKTWGLSKSISKPVVGNHEYGTSGASGYFNYFGSAAGSQGAGYYSYDVGAWHVVAINTECTRIDGAVGCAAGSPQEQWLRQDLAAHPNTCTLAYGHRPRWSSNSFASADIAPLISAMVDAKVDLYISGHSHSYERFAPQDASGTASATGLTEIVVGTGGSFYTGMGTVVPNSVVRKTQLFGVEKLTLHPGSWDYSFEAENSNFMDNGTGTCH